MKQAIAQILTVQLADTVNSALTGTPDTLTKTVEIIAKQAEQGININNVITWTFQLLIVVLPLVLKMFSKKENEVEQKPKEEIKKR